MDEFENFETSKELLDDCFVVFAMSDIELCVEMRLESLYLYYSSSLGSSMQQLGLQGE